MLLGISWIHRLWALREPKLSGQRVAVTVWSYPNSTLHYHARPQIRALFVPRILCIYIVYSVRQMPKVRTPCPHWCNTVQNQHRLDATLPNHSSQLHSSHRGVYVAVVSHIPCEYIRSIDEKRPAQILQWLAFDELVQMAEWFNKIVG